MDARPGTAAIHWFRRYSFDRTLSGVLFLILTAIAVARAFQQIYLVDIGQPFQYTLWWHVPFNLFMWWNWFLLVPVMYRILTWLTINESNLWHSFILYLLLPVILIGVRQAAASLVSTIILADKTDFFVLFYWRLFTNPWLWLDLIVYFSILLGLYLVEYQQRSKQSAVRKMQLQTQYVRSQLNALRSQLHPHFLFNTLNTVSTLILKEDNREAERMLSLLNNFLRTTAFESAGREITLRDELQFISDYLEIEKVRFSDKLAVRESIDPGTLDALVPSFLLQPIVENAIYHAIAVKPTQGTIAISAQCERDTLVISVEDDGPGFSVVKKKKKKEGVGLAITRQRLDHLYGTGFRLLAETREEGGARVTIVLPLSRMKAGEEAQ